MTLDMFIFGKIAAYGVKIHVITHFLVLICSQSSSRSNILKVNFMDHNANCSYTLLLLLLLLLKACYDNCYCSINVQFIRVHVIVIQWSVRLFETILYELIVFSLGG